MVTPKQKSGLFFNSLGAFLISFFSVKIAIILVKYLVSWIFGIKTTLVAYRLMGISPANSGVWTVSSIYAFYSAELIVSLIIFIRAFILFRVRTEIPTQRRIFYLWFGFSAIHSFFAGIIAGMVTRTNVFHFLQWLYIPGHILILIVIILLPLMVLFGWFYNKQFIITTPVKENNSKITDQRKVLFYSMFLPLLAGVVFLYIPISFYFHKYEFYEFIVLLVLAFPVLFYFYPLDYFKHSENFSKSIKYRQLYISLSGGVIFLIINALKYLLA